MAEGETGWQSGVTAHLLVRTVLSMQLAALCLHPDEAAAHVLDRWPTRKLTRNWPDLQSCPMPSECRPNLVKLIHATKVITIYVSSGLQNY